MKRKAVAIIAGITALILAGCAGDVQPGQFLPRTETPVASASSDNRASISRVDRLQADTGSRKMCVNSDGLWLRVSGSPGAAEILALVRGQAVVVIQPGDWSLVTAGGDTGWVRSMYLTACQ